MLAHTLIIVGFLLSLVCGAGVIWLYFEHLSAAYRALTGRERYKPEGSAPRVAGSFRATGSRRAARPFPEPWGRAEGLLQSIHRTPLGRTGI